MIDGALARKLGSVSGTGAMIKGVTNDLFQGLIRVVEETLGFRRTCDKVHLFKQLALCN